MGNNTEKNLSKDSLVLRIEELEETIIQMSKEKNDLEFLSFPWAGNLGQWYWQVQSNEVIFNEKKVTNLGYDIKELPKKVGFEFFTNKLHPDDYQKVMENMRKHLMNISDVYEVEYRILGKNGNYFWYYDRGKITKRDENGKAIVVSGIVFDISKRKILENKLKVANKRLEELVIKDDLTGVYNRRYMVEQIKNEISGFNSNKMVFSLIMLDVDNFKFVNDNFGHSVGDIVLKKLVKTVLSRLRKTDSLCRWGGEEFIILLPNTEKEEAVLLAEDLKSVVKKMVINEVGSITASFGVTSLKSGETIDNVLKKVDDLMYKAKFDGKDCVRYD